MSSAEEKRQKIDNWVALCTLNRHRINYDFSSSINTHITTQKSNQTTINSILFDLNNQESISSQKLSAMVCGAVMIDKPLIPPHFNFSHIKQAHKIIFSQENTKAGKTRRANVSLQQSQFCLPNLLEEKIDDFLYEMENDNFLQTHHSESLAKLGAYYFNHFNMIHPFSFGNGIINRYLITALLEARNIHLDWTNINFDEYLLSCEYAFHGDNRDLEHLFAKCLN